jgi:hypothetical protein
MINMTILRSMMRYAKTTKRDLRIILDLDPLVIGINLDMGIKQWNLIDSHLLISSSRSSSLGSNKNGEEGLGFIT